MPDRRQAEGGEAGIEQALLAEHDQPAIGAHHLADEERQEQADQQQLAQPGRGVRTMTQA